MRTMGPSVSVAVPSWSRNKASESIAASESGAASLPGRDGGASTAARTWRRKGGNQSQTVQSTAAQNNGVGLSSTFNKSGAAWLQEREAGASTAARTWRHGDRLSQPGKISRSPAQRLFWM